MNQGRQTLQMRSNDDKRLYNVNRDVAWNFKFVVQEVAERLEKGRWPELTQVLLDPRGVTDEALGEAAKAFITFVCDAADQPKETMTELLIRSGWFKLEPAAQVAYMATLGVVMSGIYFHGARMATMGGEGPCSDMAGLLAAAASVANRMTAPRWLRPILRMVERIKAAINVFRSR